MSGMMNGRYDIWRTAAPDDDPDDDQVENRENDYDPVDCSGPDNSRDYEDTITKEELCGLEPNQVELMKANKTAFEQRARAEAYAALLQEIADWYKAKTTGMPGVLVGLGLAGGHELKTLHAKIVETLAAEITVESIIIKAIDKPE